MAEVKLRALGLREVDFGDFDRYLTALTEDGRRIEILCKNARRGKKQNPAARQLCYSEFILSDRGGRYTLRDADLVHSFFALAGDIEKYALSCYLNELDDRPDRAGFRQSGLVPSAAVRAVCARGRQTRPRACQGGVRVAYYG